MPIYEYQCSLCQHKFELIQKISDEPANQCPKCFETSVRRLISPAGFQLKGTGWYVTDFKNKSSGSDKKNPGSSGESSSKKSEKSE